VKIVVVDDDRTTLALLEKTLILRGFWVYSARDGEEGYALVQKEMPDLLISDMLMPKIHGLDLCKKIKTTQELKHIKVIMMTGVYKGSVGRKETEKEGGDAFIVKPIDTQLLLKQIFDLLDIDEEKFNKEYVKREPDNN